MQPWYQRYKNNESASAIIIGGGISGAATAYSLAIRGYKVRLYEKNHELAGEGSGNYQGLVYGTLHGNYTPLTELHFLGLSYSHNLIQKLLTKSIDYDKSGLIQIYNDNKTMKMYEAITKNHKIFQENLNQDQKNHLFPIDIIKHNTDSICTYLNHDEIEKISKVKITPSDGLYFPNGIWLHPKNFVQKLVAHPNIQIILNMEIDDLKLIKNIDNYTWQIKSKNQIIDTTENLVLCNAHATLKFSYTSDLLLRKTHGQTTKIKLSNSPQTSICRESYIIPESNGYATIGATFNHHSSKSEINDCDHLENINNISKFLPNIKNTQLDNLMGHAAIRCGSPDYLPIVGPVAEAQSFYQTYKNLALDKNLQIDSVCPYLPGLYLNLAHGAKGFTTAPISGEIVAGYISNNTLICSENLRQKIHPNRMLLKNIIFKKFS